MKWTGISGIFNIDAWRHRFGNEKFDQQFEDMFVIEGAFYLLMPF